MIISVKNISGTERIWGGVLIEPQASHELNYLDIQSRAFISGAFISDWLVGYAEVSVEGSLKTDLASVIDALSGEKKNVSTLQEVEMSWAELKAFYDANATSAYMFFTDFTTHYYIWCTYQQQKFIVPELKKADAIEFEASYKIKCNITEAPTVRITTNRYGRRYHERFGTFKTSSPGSLCNLNYLGVDGGDVTYSMWNSNYQVTTDPTEAESTIVDFMPEYCYEIANGRIWIPNELDGNDDDFWEVHVVAVPDIPESMGGSLVFVQNPHLKWVKGQTLYTDSSMNPANLRCHPTLPTNKIRFIIHHPVGAVSEFQIALGMFRCVGTILTCEQHLKGVR